jgi:hypothetical protein
MFNFPRMSNDKQLSLSRNRASYLLLTKTAESDTLVILCAGMVVLININSMIALTTGFVALLCLSWC